MEGWVNWDQLNSHTGRAWKPVRLWKERNNVFSTTSQACWQQLELPCCDFKKNYKYKGCVAISRDATSSLERKNVERYWTRSNLLKDSLLPPKAPGIQGYSGIYSRTLSCTGGQGLKANKIVVSPFKNSASLLQWSLTASQEAFPYNVREVADHVFHTVLLCFCVVLR